MPEEKILAQIALPLVQTDQVSPPEQRFAPKFEPEQVADIVAKNCGGCRGRNDQPYVQRVMRTCVNSRANENGFSRQGDAGALEQDNPEDHNIPIRRKEFVDGCLIQKGHASRSNLKPFYNNVVANFAAHSRIVQACLCPATPRPPHAHTAPSESASSPVLRPRSDARPWLRRNRPWSLSF